MLPPPPPKIVWGRGESLAFVMYLHLSIVYLLSYQLCYRFSYIHINISRYTQLETRKLQQVSYHLCVRIACSGLIITSLLQVVSRLAVSCELHAGLMQVVSLTCGKSVNIKWQLQVWCSQTSCNFMKSTGLIQLVVSSHNFAASSLWLCNKCLSGY